MMNFMNTSNPFQIPVCLQRADSQQRKRERFKRSFIAVVAAIVVLLVGLLIEGCMTEKSTAAAPTPGQKITVQPAPQVNTDTIAEQKPNQVSPPALDTTRQPAVPVASESTAASGHVKAVYVVKSGDTLTRIAKVHGTTVKALKTANNLNNDRIVVGAKLKIPEA
jgi:LysM repeat protein